MRLGRVYFSSSYVVDLDDKDMVSQAKDAVFDDVTNAIKFNEAGSWIKIEADPNAEPGDIPEFLQTQEV